MKKKEKRSGIQIRYLKYTVCLLLSAMVLCGTGVGWVVQKNQETVMMDNYNTMCENLGAAMDLLFDKTDEATADCIVYDGVQKSLRKSAMSRTQRSALSRYFAFINLDDITHIDFLKDCAGIPETICCRYNPGGVFQLGTDIMDNPGDAKYGMTKEQMIEAFKRLKELGAKRFGIHSFLASNTVSNEYYPTLAGILFELAVELKEKTGVEIAFINLSGGVGIPYTPDKEPNNIEIIGDGVRQKFEEIMVPAGMGDVAIFTELGRFMLAPYGGLVTKAIHEKHIYKEYIGVDACAANLMRPAMYGAYHHITVLGKEDAPCDHKYDVTGSLCENNDKFAIDRMLPKIDMGDYLFIHDAGAHGFSMGYNYNGRLRSSELLLQEDGSVKMIRRAETPADYFATFDFCDILK